MPNSEAQEVKEEEVDALVEEIKNGLDNDMDGFKSRLANFRVQVMEYCFQPQEFMIMADAYLTFYKMNPDTQLKWLEGTISNKQKLLMEIEELEENQTIIERSMHFADILFYTHTVTGETIHQTAATRLLYVLTGLEGFLTGVGMSLYKIPPQRKERKPFKMPESRAEGMYH